MFILNVSKIIIILFPEKTSLKNKKKRIFIYVSDKSSYETIFPVKKADKHII